MPLSSFAKKVLKKIYLGLTRYTSGSEIYKVSLDLCGNLDSNLEEIKRI